MGLGQGDQGSASPIPEQKYIFFFLYFYKLYYFNINAETCVRIHTFLAILENEAFFIVSMINKVDTCTFIINFNYFF